ncbi:YolD-like family protein [Bacillus subtilis]|nr:YolD-like family protein [Bacillus subtilis]
MISGGNKNLSCPNTEKRYSRKIETKKVEKPVLDEYQLEEMARVISEAMEFNSQINISYYRNGFIEEVIGHVHYINEIKQKLLVKDLKGDTNFIAFDSIVSVYIK